MPLIELKDAVVDVETVGDGPDLVLLHSLLIDRSAFDRVMPDLMKTRRVHRVALPGFDRSTQAGPKVEDYADRIAAMMRAMALPTTTTVLGNGFGGFIALALAIRHGASFDRLVLVDSAAGFPEAGKAAFQVMAEKVNQGGMGAIAEIAARRIFHDAYIAANPQVIAERRAILERFQPASFVAACNALREVDFQSLLGSVRNPTTVIVGELDAATPLPLARKLAENIADARFVLLPGCGHCPPLEQPREFISALAPLLG
jgi:pimeloyl-ACP methyl ester carboxylesterase